MEIPPPLTPPHKGRGTLLRCRVAQISTILACKAAPASPSPLWGGDRGGGKKPRKFHMRLPCLKGGDRAGRRRRTHRARLEIGESINNSRSPPLRGRCPAGQRGVRRDAGSTESLQA